MRKDISKYEPNAMHKSIAELEKDYDVTVITQNVDDLHGELTKMRSTNDTHTFYTYNQDIKVGDLGNDYSQLRPHIVLFGEQPYNYTEASEALMHSKIKIVIGTSFSIGYTLPLVWAYPRGLYIDPKPSVLRNNGINDQSITYIKKKATYAINDMLNYIKEF